MDPLNIDCFVHPNQYSDTDRATIVQQAKTSFQSSGLILISHHNVDISPKLLELLHSFYALPTADKRSVSYRAPIPRGYSGCAKENFAILSGHRKPNDLVEKFRMGPFDLPVDPEHPDHAYYHQDRRAAMMFYPNKWPLQLPAFQSEMEGLYQQMTTLANTLSQLLAACLNLPHHFFEDKMDKPTSILSANHYPPLPNQIQPGQLRLAQHTDVDLFTILSPGSKGLEVQIDNKWIPVPHCPGTLVVNIGDGMRDWTQGTFASTVHRVVLPARDENTSRYAIGFFVGANYDARMHSLSTKDSTQPTKTYLEWRKQRIQQALRVKAP